MVDMKAAAAYHTSEAAKRALRRRRARETRFKMYGVLAVSLAATALVALIWTIGANAVNAIYAYSARIDVEFADDSFALDELLLPYEQQLIADGVMSEKTVVIRKVRAQIGDALNQGLLENLAGVGDENRRDAVELLSEGNVNQLFDQISGGDVDTLLARLEQGEIGAGDSVQGFRAELSDDPQLYLKGAFGDFEELPTRGALTMTAIDGEIRLFSSAADFRPALGAARRTLRREAMRTGAAADRQNNGVRAMQALLAEPGLTEAERTKAEADLARFTAERDRLAAIAADLRARADGESRAEALTAEMSSAFVYVNGGVVKLTRASDTEARGQALRPLNGEAEAKPGTWSLRMVESPEAVRNISDGQVVWLEQLRSAGAIESNADWAFLTSVDSTRPELAGIKGALIGTFWAMLVTFALAFPIGVMAAIYLEEFAPKNAFTDFIEVNINNLAAIPSIIFGLFGLLLLLTGFTIPIGGGATITIGGWFAGYRSAAFVGGTVLALMTLPTIIIASRAALRAVPPSIRSAALGVGASKVQAVFHHVLPLAMPGILTGAIIGMAQALGETAPILMVGMVGFFVDVATDVSDPTTVMPAIIYFWSDYPEKLFELKTSLAIVGLLTFLIAMNSLAVLLRRRFERRW